MSPVRGILLKIMAIALFSVMAALAKAAMEVVPTGQAVFFRALFAFPIILGWLIVQGDLLEKLRTQQPLLHVWRGLFGSLAMGLNFLALSLLPLPEVTVIGFIAPIITLILAVFLLGETVRLFRWSMVALGLVGVLIVIWPRLTWGADTASTIALVGVASVLASASLRAFVQIHIRKMVKTEHPSAIVFYFTLIVTIASLATMPFGWVWPDPFVLAMLIASGLIGGAAQLLHTSALRYSDASVLAPYDYVAILFAMVIGYVWFSEIPTVPMLVGAVLVILSGVLIVLRERRLGLAERQDKTSVTPQG